jgi:hypothetical protein
MDIGPIGGIRLVPPIKERPVDPELTAFFAIESTARPGDDAYSRSGKKAAGAEESEEEDGQELELDGEDGGAMELDAAPMPPGRQISFFV